MLYIVLFLHQTTTIVLVSLVRFSCISYYSYIKPQLDLQVDLQTGVVYRTIPTSNHNLKLNHMLFVSVVYRTIPTSNHNLTA